MKAKTLFFLILFFTGVNFIHGQTSGTYTLENDSLKATITLPSMQINAYYKINGQSYTTSSLGGYTVTSIDASIPKKLVVKTTSQNITFSLSGNAIDIVLSGDANASIGQFQFPGHIVSKSNDYLIVPRASGMITPVTQDFPYYGAFYFYIWKSTMSFVGVTNLKSGYMIVSDDPWDTGVILKKSGTETTVNPKLMHVPSKGKLGYSRTVHLVFVNNGYVEMAQWYKKSRTKLGWNKTLAEKAAVNPNVNKLKGAVDFWAYYVGNDKTFYDKLYSFGMDRVLYNLELPNQPGLATYLNSKGALTSTYDLYTDVYATNAIPGYTSTEGYSADVIVKSNGGLQEGFVAYANGSPIQAYYRCPSTHVKYAQKSMASKLPSNPLNSIFVDVELSQTLLECYSSVHPLTRHGDAQARVGVMSYLKNDKSLVAGSEEHRDFANSVTDYSQGPMTVDRDGVSNGDWFSPVTVASDNVFVKYNVNPAVRVPMFQLAYHDSNMATSQWGDGVSRVPAYWDDKDLFNILYASMPLFFPPSRTYWDANFERFMTSYHLSSSISRNVGFENMTNHTFLTSDWKVQQTEFSNGWKITANFNSSSYQYGSKLLAPKGFYATDGAQNEVFKLVDSGSNLAAAFTGDRLYMNPYGVEKTYKGIKTSGSVFLRKDASSVHLAFIGSQTSIKVNPSLMPWVPKRAFSEATGKEIAMTNLGGGWFQINRPSGENFVRLELDIVMSQEDDIQVRQIECYPNPVRGELYVDMDLPNSQNVSVSLFNLTGKAVRVLMNSIALPGLNNLKFNMDGITPGTYVLSIKTEDKSVSKKIVVL